MFEHVRGDLHERLQDRPAGVVHDDVDTAEFRQRDFGKASRGVEVGHVGRCHDSPTAQPPDLAGDGSQRRLVSAGEHRVTPGFSQCQRTRCSDPASRAGDDGDLAVEPESFHHRTAQPRTPRCIDVVTHGAIVVRWRSRI